MMLPWEPKAGRCLENDESCGLPIRLVPRDPRLLFFGYFLRTTPPRLAPTSINRRPSSCALGLRGGMLADLKSSSCNPVLERPWGLSAG